MDEQGSSRRAARKIVDKKGRFAALAKLKELKGSKHKYEVTELENVYEEVDEREYSKRVRQRQDDDWIIDDGGEGYVEDGREIFDDDLDDESIIQASKKKKRGDDQGKSKKVRLSSSSDSSSKTNSIHKMLLNMPSKKKEKSVNLDSDDILDEIMGEIDRKPQSKNDSTDLQELSPLSSEETAQRYLRGLAQPKPISAKRKYTHFEKQLEVNSSEVSIENSALPVMFGADSSKSVSKSLFSNTVDKADSVVCEVKNDDFCEVKKENVSEEKEEFLKAVEDFSIFNEEDFNDVKEEPSESIVSSIGKPQEKKGIQGLSHETQIPEVSPRTNGHVLSSENLGNILVESFDQNNIPIVTNASDQKVFRFFCLDIQEETSRKAGIVFLFGKVWIESANANVSCCVTVHNVERRVFVLPREKFVSTDGQEKEVSILDVYNELCDIVSQHGVSEFRFQKIQKNNCFDPDISSTAEYMEVKYSAKYPNLPSDLKGKTFSHVFGMSSSPLECFIIERGIKGPCWLDVQNITLNTNKKWTWCKLEVSVEKMDYVASTQSSVKLAPPNVSLLSLQVKTVVNPKSNNNDIALVVGLVNQNFPLDHQPSQKLYSHCFCILAPLSDKAYPSNLHDSMKKECLIIERMDSENALLKNLVRKINRLDPDLVVGHDILGFDLEVLVHRMLAYKIPNWSQISRLQRQATSYDKKKLFFSKNFLCGRLTCDVMLSAKELIQNVRSYDLETLCSTVLDKETHPALTYEEIRRHYDSSDKLITLVKKSLLDAVNGLQLLCHMSAIPLALQISNIAGNTLSRTLIGGRAERNEFLLLHAFHEKNFIPPDKVNMKNPSKTKDDAEPVKGRKKPAYSGGLVLEPKKGLYDKMVLVMDFNSLYPSIIMEYNICFTTVPISFTNDNIMPNIPSKEISTGILPAEIQKLVESRISVKNMLKGSHLTPIEKSQLHTRQLALKLMANSMYGCLGFTNARFYAKPLAALITAKGRELLMNTKEIVENLNYEVIYGDTDSIMINTNTADFQEVMKIGKQIKQSINKIYRCVKLDIDGIYKYTLLLKKKKYAVMEVICLPDGTLKTQIKHKGLDIVRRDWSRIAVESGHYVVEQILSDTPLEERLLHVEQHLQKIGKDLEAGNVPLPLLTITKQLTKSVEQYQDSKSQPHVMVAKRLIKKGMCKMKAGDMVSYVICEDGTDSAPTQRAYHLDELKADKNLKIDFKYYLAHQIHPVITRLLDPVDGIDACRIAELLGLDPSSYKQSLQQKTYSLVDPEESTDLVLHDPEYFKNCEKFSFTCPQCKTKNIVDKPYRGNKEVIPYPTLSKCSNLECSVSPIQYLPSIQNQLTFTIRNHVRQYSIGGLICEDPGCYHRTNYVSQNFHRAYPICGMCKEAIMYKKVSDRDLYMQLYFFQHTFDIQSAAEFKSGIKPSPEVEVAYKTLYDHVAKYLQHSSYSQVNLQHVFQFCSAAAGRHIEYARKIGVSNEELKQKHLQ